MQFCIAEMRLARRSCKANLSVMQHTSPVPTTSLSLIIPGLVEPEGVLVRTQSTPIPKAGEVLIAMEATGVSFAEVQMLRGRYPGQPAFPFVPGYDVVGRVVALGSGVDSSLMGKRVATLTGFGAWAEFVVLEASHLVVVPEELDAAEVDALIVNGLTAYKMLHRTARIRPGQTVVVLGAGGGVGTMLVQLARLAGAHVIGTCKPAQRALVESMGAQVVDYTQGNVSEEVRALAPTGVDAVFDHVGGSASLQSSYAMLRPRGFLVCYGTASLAKSEGSAWIGFLQFIGWKLRWSLRVGGPKSTFFDVWGRGTLGADQLFRPARFWRELREDLGHLVNLLAEGALKPQVAQRIPLREAGAALAVHRAGRFTGKIVLEGNAVG